VQDLLWILHELADSGQIPKLPVFVDSPMALDVTEIYRRHVEEYNPAMLQALQQGRSPFHGAQHRLLRTVEESKSLNEREGPMIIIAGNGMITGGRILHHLEQRLSSPNNAVLLVGYQAAGTRGRSLQEGATELRMHGHFVPVRARIEAINGLSAHGDQAELMRWLSGFEKAPTQTYVVHGEPEAAAALAKLISEQLGWQVAVARDDETIFLDTL
jgi:metallo-beta-lactamase family protein